MKKIFIVLLVLGIGGSIYAQETFLFTAKLKKNEVPKVILKAVDRDFINLTTVEFLSVPENFVAPLSLDIDKDENSEYDSYMITFAGKTEKIMATYNKDGKLISTVDRYKTRSAPFQIYSTLGDLYPEWIIKDGYKKMSIYDTNGKVKKQIYKLALENGNRTRKVYLNKDGKLVNSLGKLKM